MILLIEYGVLVIIFVIILNNSGIVDLVIFDVIIFGSCDEYWWYVE